MQDKHQLSLLLHGGQNGELWVTGDGTQKTTSLYDLAETVEIWSKALFTQMFIWSYCQKAEAGKNFCSEGRKGSFIIWLEQMHLEQISDVIFLFAVIDCASDTISR